MPTLAINQPTYIDFLKREDADGKIERSVVELLAQTNEILEDMVVIEGNLPTGHKTTVRTGMPDVTWRKLNYGVKPSKSSTAQVTDTAGMLEAYAQVDKDLADLNGNDKEWRLSEETAFLERMSQEMAFTTFYGDTAVNPERFLGLSKRYDDSRIAVAQSAKNVLKAGGSTNLTSVYLVVWGKSTVHGFYPKGSKHGIKMEDKGQITLDDGAGGLYEGYRSHYKWDLGLTVRDWRYVVRISNIDTVALATAGETSDTSANLTKLMLLAKNLVPNLRAGKAAWYMNDLVKTYLEVKLLNSDKLVTRQTFEDGHETTKFMGIPIRRVDQIINAESVVS